MTHSKKNNRVKRNIILILCGIIFVGVCFGAGYGVKAIFDSFRDKKPSQSTQSPIPKDTTTPLSTKAPSNTTIPEEPVNTQPKDPYIAEDGTRLLPRSVDSKFRAEYDIVYKKDGEKTVYLTFDDGPSKLTKSVLDVLKEQGVKATFFILGNNIKGNESVLKRIFDEGNMIANHSTTHNYKDIYASANNFKQEILNCQKLISDVIGVENTYRLMRFPGGSSNKSRTKFKLVANEMDYMYIDWNATNDDGVHNRLTKEQAVAAAIKYSKKKEDVVLLMHDSANKKSTLAALPQIIAYYKENGYTFKTLREYMGIPKQAERVLVDTNDGKIVISQLEKSISKLF